MEQENKIQTLHLFPVIDKLLIELLKSLTEEEWNAQTIAKLWKVKDVASHLLDGNLKGLSTSRDAYFGDKPENINTYQDLVAYLNQLNLSWTSATKRLSPQILISLLEITGKEYYEHLKALKPFDKAIFSVAWAGQEASQNWFHLAREYTEKFLHQQQIRDAVGKDGIMTREFFYPFLATCMYAFPHTFRHIQAETGTVVALKVLTEIGGQWNIIKSENDWKMSSNDSLNPDAQVTMHPNVAWKLFSKSWRPEQVIDTLEITGDRMLGEQVLNIVSVMA